MVSGLPSTDYLALFQTLKNVTWFKERTLTEITLGGLLILVVIRTIQFNMTRMRVMRMLSHHTVQHDQDEGNENVITPYSST